MVEILSTTFVTQIEDNDNGQVLGYGIESNPTEAERELRGAKDRLQRWILFFSSKKELSKHPNLALRKAQAAPWRNIGDAVEFVKQITEQGVFVPGRDTYAVVNCWAGTQGETIDVREPGQYPPGATPTEFQIDFRLAHIVLGANVVGYVNSISGGTGLAHESWALLDGYAPPGTPGSGGAVPDYRIEPITNLGSTDFAKLIDGRTWTAQHTFVQAMCAYFTDRVVEKVESGVIVPV